MRNERTASNDSGKNEMDSFSDRCWCEYRSKRYSLTSCILSAYIERTRSSFFVHIENRENSVCIWANVVNKIGLKLATNCQETNNNTYLGIPFQCCYFIIIIIRYYSACVTIYYQHLLLRTNNEYPISV